jgi:hypothetical protein
VLAEELGYGSVMTGDMSCESRFYVGCCKTTYGGMLDTLRSAASETVQPKRHCRREVKMAMTIS